MKINFEGNNVYTKCIVRNNWQIYIPKILQYKNKINIGDEVYIYSTENGFLITKKEVKKDEETNEVQG